MIPVALTSAIVGAIGGIALGWAIRDNSHPHIPHPHAGARRMSHIISTGPAEIEFGMIPPHDETATSGDQ